MPVHIRSKTMLPLRYSTHKGIQIDLIKIYFNTHLWKKKKNSFKYHIRVDDAMT